MRDIDLSVKKTYFCRVKFQALSFTFFRNYREVSLEEKIKNAYYSKDKLPYHGS